MNLPPLLRILLWPFSLLYGWCVRARAAAYANGWLKQNRLRGKVISVGNVTVGGTGKTPMVMWLAEKFLAQGNRVAILSRGYRGSGGTSDEVELMKRRLGDRVAFGVGKNRFEQGKRIEERAPIDIFLLDDGFQHLALARDADIVMLDGTRRVKGQLLPAGPMREPVDAYLRADILVVTRKSEPREIATLFADKFSIFYGQTRLLGFRRLGEESELRYGSEIGPGPFFAFCGIGNPQAFFDDLAHWHVPLAGKQHFRDHHRYSASDLGELKDAALRAGAIAFVTTEKDACNITNHRDPHDDVRSREKVAGLPTYVAVIDLALSSESEFDAALARKLSARPAAGSSPTAAAPTGAAEP
jgi:tetraacyldisaccharide 4'-kinase